MIVYFTLPFIHIFMLGYIVTGFMSFGKYFITVLFVGSRILLTIE